MSEGEDTYFHTEEEVKLKDIVWTAMNQDYIDKQALKAATQKQKERHFSCEAESFGMQQEEEEPLAVVEAGKRGRGRPKGSKSKPKPEDSLAPADSAAEGVKAVLNARKLSKRVNYANIDDLFKEPHGSPPSDKDQPTDFICGQGDSVPATPPAEGGKIFEAEIESMPGIKATPAQLKSQNAAVRKHKPTIFRKGMRRGGKTPLTRSVGSVKESFLTGPPKNKKADLAATAP